jgi:Gamma-glutamyl cyclotransferase, AIG2-like
MATKTEKVFVYRTLEDKTVDYKALGHYVEKAKKVVLPGFRDINRGKGYHTILRDPSSQVRGVELFVSEDDLRKLDAWENKYRRIKVTLQDGSQAWAYQIKVHQNHLAKKIAVNYISCTQ